MVHLWSCAALLYWPLSVSLTGPTSLKITRQQPLLTIQEDTEWPGHSSTYSCSWPSYYKTSGPAPWQEPPSKTWPHWCLNCGSREPSTIWLQTKLISLLSFSTSFYILMNTSSSDATNHQLGAFFPSPWLASPCLSNYNSTLNLNPCYRPSNCLPSGLVTYPSSLCQYGLSF